MSAFVVSDAHINAIVNFTLICAPAYKLSGYSFQGEYHEWPSPEKLGQILLDENVRSVNARYSNKTEPDTFVFKRTWKAVSAVTMLKALDCLDYQSCESSDWEDTLAYRLIEVMRQWTIGRLPGYEEAEWGIEDEPAMDAKLEAFEAKAAAYEATKANRETLVACLPETEAPKAVSHETPNMIFEPREYLGAYCTGFESGLMDDIMDNLDWDIVLAAVEADKAHRAEDARKRNTSKLIAENWNK